MLESSDKRFQRTLRALKALSECNQAVIRAETEVELLNRVCEVICETGGYRLVWIGYKQDDAEKSVLPVAQAGFEEGYLERARITWADTERGQGPTGRAIRSGTPQISRNILTDEKFAPWREDALKRGYASSIALPLLLNGEVLGTLNIYSSEPDAFDEEELKLLTELAADLSYGISSLRTRSAREIAERRIRFINRLALEIGAAHNFQEALQIAVKSICEETGWLFGEAWVPNSRGDALICKASWLSEEGTEDLRDFMRVSAGFNFEIGKGLPGSVWKSKKPVWVSNVTEDPNFPRAPHALQMGLKSGIGIPVLADGEVVAVLDFFVREVRAEDETLIEFISSCASQVGMLFRRMQVEEQARQRAELLDSANDAIIVRDMEGRILYCNKGTERLFGWRQEEVVGKTSAEIMGFDPQTEDITRKLLETGYWSGEIKGKDKDGEELILLSTRTLVRDEDGNPKAIFVVNTDITEKKLLEAQFFRAQRMESIGRLAGGIAHDLNNVLAPILIALEVLKDKVSDDEGMRILATLETSVKRGADLVKQILSFSRGVAGERAIVDLRSLLEQQGKMLSETFPKNIEVSVAYAKDLWPVIGDKTQIEQVLMNLSVNARDAMPNGGSLNIYAENIYIDENYAKLHIEARKGPYVVISVSDTGIGISAKHIDKIFEPFFTTKEPGVGTGIGLSTAYTIVKSHGGFINVYSEVGKGTKMKVYLPASEVPKMEIEELRVSSAELPRGSGETILLADDEACILEMTRLTLEAFGYETLSAKNGVEALALYRAHKEEVSAVILDMMMPVMDGPSTARAILQLNPEAKIILATGLDQPEEDKELKALRIRGVLVKPFDAKSLLEMLSDVLAD